MANRVYGIVAHDGRWGIVWDRHAAIRRVEEAGGGEVRAMPASSYRERRSWDLAAFRAQSRRVATVRGRKAPVAA